MTPRELLIRKNIGKGIIKTLSLSDGQHLLSIIDGLRKQYAEEYKLSGIGPGEAMVSPSHPLVKNPDASDKPSS